MRSGRLLHVLLPLSGVLAGCAQPRQLYVRPAPVNQIALNQAVSSAASQVRRCYRAPRVSSEGRRISTRLRVRVTPDGTLSGLPAIIGQDGVDASNRVYAGRMAEAAIQSVLRCAPLRLPQEVHRGAWIDIDLTFSQSAAA
jgi:hypothetical protein